MKTELEVRFMVEVTRWWERLPVALRILIFGCYDVRGQLTVWDAEEKK